MEECNITIIPELKEKFLKFKNVLRQKIKTDPENEPYKSKYEARDILQEISDFITEQKRKEPQNNYLNDLLAVVFCMISSISYDVEELSIGNEFAKKSLDLIPTPIHPSRVTCAMTCLNNLGFWACNSENYTEAQELLEQSEGYYHQYNFEIKDEATEFEVLFTGDPKDAEEKGFEKCHTQTLFYLAQVYSKKENPTKSAKYCHTTLKRQLEAGDEDSVEWALNSATLSQFLIEQNAFKEARHHLAASLAVLEKHNLDIDKLLAENLDNEELKAKKESVRHRLADIYRCWAKYSIFLLNCSKDRLMSSEGDRLDPPPEPPEILKGIKFPSLEEEVKDLQKSVTADFILTYEDAKPLFQTSQEWLNKAKEYYTLEDHASEHAAVIQDSSKLYHLLSFYQSDEAIQCKLHKRRIDMLITVVNALNSKYYLKVCQEIWFEIGEASMTMADIKATQAREYLNKHHCFGICKGEPSKPFEDVHKSKREHCLSKVKQLTLQGIKYLKEFVESFKLKSKEDTYPEGFEKNIFLAYMYLGHMYARVQEPDKAGQVDLQEESLQCYTALLDYCTAHPDKKQLYAEEYSICKEMVELIPLKIRGMKSMIK